MADSPQAPKFPVVPKDVFSAMLKKLPEELDENSYYDILTIISALRKDRSQATSESAIAESGKSVELLQEPGADKLRQIPLTGELAKGKPGLLGMKEWLGKLGYTKDDTGKIDFIHVAGMHGKSCTSAYIEGLLLAHGEHTKSPRTIGLYTSPHMEAVEERFRINGGQLSKTNFVKYAGDVLRRLDIINSEPSERPGYQQFLTLLSFNIFVGEGVNVAIYECVDGGQFDSTNFISNPIVTAVTQISDNPSDTLGSDLQAVAWHYSGIFKRDIPAVYIQQDHLRAANGLFKRAGEQGLKGSQKHKRIEVTPVVDLQYREVPLTDAQTENFALAYKVYETYLEQKNGTGNNGVHAGNQLEWEIPSDPEIKAIIRHDSSSASLPGRFERIERPENWHIYCVDAANTPKSMIASYQWFEGVAPVKDGKRNTMRVLLFGLAPNPNASTLLESLGAELKRQVKDSETFSGATTRPDEEREKGFFYAFFAPTQDAFGYSLNKQKAINQELLAYWEKEFPLCKAYVVESLTGALQAVSSPSKVLILGTPQFITEALPLTKSGRKLEAGTQEYLMRERPAQHWPVELDKGQGGV